MAGAKESNPEAVQENTGLAGFEEVEEAFTFCNLSSDNCDELTRKSSVSPSKLSHSSSTSTGRAAATSNASLEKKKQEKSDREDCEGTEKGHAGRKLSAETYDSSMRKGSNLPPLMKSRSHPVRSGAGKFSMEMGLSDMKMMQSKRISPPAMFSPENESDKKDNRSKDKRQEKILRGFCRGKASVDCIPYF
ncbi:hypothetical protein OIU79_005808 [Salix purpurea]|uniref:Uncharacterized protein n=1 Tax=Salix purpurea TaxID=77065 RepID=A0A9Q0TTR2_SALPP|nr:hypothetical protein OIU79_005808 [Salix purpurea]